MKNFTIRTRFIVVLSIILLSGFLGTNIISYNVSKNLVRTSILGISLPLARDNIYSEIQKDLMRPIFVSSLMANDTFLKDWVISGEKDPLKIKRYLGEVKDKYGFFSAFFVSDQTRNYYHFKGLHKKIDPKDDHDIWYYKFKDMNLDHDLDVDSNEAAQNHLTIFINHRLNDHNGRFLGVVGVGLGFDLIADLLNRYKKKYNRDVYMVSQDGLVQVHTDSEKILKTNIFNETGIKEHARQIIASTESPAIFEYDSKGEHILLTTRYIKELDWYLLVEQNQNQAMASVKNTFIRNIIFSLLITILTIVITFLVINYFQKQIITMASIDKLTKAFNRNEFERRFDYLSGMSKRNMLTMSIILFDIDHFKNINDTMGHIFGDLVLKNIADTAQGLIRENDILVRWGGDEFIMLILNDHDHVITIARRLQASIRDTGFYQNDGKMIRSKTGISVSCGIAQYIRGETLDSLMIRADAALYLAKEKGRDCIASEKELDSQVY